MRRQGVLLFFIVPFFCAVSTRKAPQYRTHKKHLRIGCVGADDSVRPCRKYRLRTSAYQCQQKIATGAERPRNDKTPDMSLRGAQRRGNLLPIIMRTEQSRKPWLSRLPALFRCKDFGQNCPKPLHLPLERLSVPAEIRIVTMSEFRKNSSFGLFLRNCAALAARINRKAVYSVDIIISIVGSAVMSR